MKNIGSTKARSFFYLQLDNAKQIVQKYGLVYYDSPKNSENITVLRHYKNFKEYENLLEMRTKCEQSNITV
jgi:5-bromo-4-chloroindolyl phosphate hydrolysis protein